jgi:hypothetical protein
MSSTANTIIRVNCPDCDGEGSKASVNGVVATALLNTKNYMTA